MEQQKELKKRRMLMMVSGASIIFFTGFPHVWSIFQPYMMEGAGWSQGQASMCFYLALATFVFGNIIGGRMQDTGSPKKVLWIGGLFFALGVLLSAYMLFPSPIPFYITYGVMQGFGQGMVYTTVISTGGSEDGSSDHGIRCTDPGDAAAFCKETGVDALAVAIGNAHGNYPVAPKLAFDVLEKIHQTTGGRPLVLHGGSGITDEDFQTAIKKGIVKVNIATASFNQLTKRVEGYMRTEGPHNYFSLNEAMAQGTYENVKHHIEVFNC